MTKKYNVIIFYDQAVVSDIKRYEEIRKPETGQVRDYTTAWFLIRLWFHKNHYRLITVDLSGQKESDADPKAIQQREFTGQLEKLDADDNATDERNNDQSMLVLTILEKIKEARLKFSQGSVTIVIIDGKLSIKES